jgi:hypothetical protein
MALGILVGRFGTFVRERHDAPVFAKTSGRTFPDALEHLRECFAPHLIPLALLARADGSACAAEREIILDHCAQRAGQMGKPFSDSDRALLSDYLASFRPTLMQLDIALKEVEAEGPESMASLLMAAQELVKADGRVTEEETRLLDDMEDELASS